MQVLTIPLVLSAGGALPEHFLNPQLLYDSNSYMSSIGTGDTLDAARKSALQALSQQIKVDINSSESVKETLSQTENASGITNFENNTNIFSHTKVGSNQEILGVQYGDSITDPTGIVYTIAFLERSAVGQIYRQKISENDKQIASFIEQSKNELLLNTYSLLTQAQQTSVENDALIEQILVIDEVQGKIASIATRVSTDDINVLLDETARNITMFIDTGITGNADNIITSKINSIIGNLFSDLKFSVVNNTSNSAYTAKVSVIWNSDEVGKYPAIDWDVNLQIVESTGKTVISSSKRGKSKANDVESAAEFAINDINKVIVASFKTYILENISQ